MKRLILPVALLLAALLPLTSQDKDRYGRLPDGRSQAEAILKADHEKSLQEAAELLKLAEELKTELEENDRHVLSVTSIRTAEKIEKLAKRIKNRLKRY